LKGQFEIRRESVSISREQRMSGTVRVVAKVAALPGKSDEVREALCELIEPTRREAGCLTYELWQNKSDPTDFTFVEERESDAALQAHAVSEHLKVAAAKLKNLVQRPTDVRRYDLVR
jgi:quinol monooxygenase YgiN